jgi:ribonuclease HI
MTSPTQPGLFDGASGGQTDNAADPLDAILAAVLALSPQERDLLWRRLRAVGLLTAAGDVTDRARLAVAPAVAGRRSAAQESATPSRTPAAAVTDPRFVSPTPPASTAPSTPTTMPTVPTVPTLPTVSPAPAPSRATSAPDQPYRSTVSGKVVVKSTEPDAEPSPHEMAPLPGQAPEQPIGVVFDGGSKGNPGQGYGSYALRWPGQAEQIVKLRFGNHVTNNEAEYDTLIAALEAILARLEDGGADPGTATVQVKGDSLLVINQIKGKWKCKQDHLRVRRDKARSLLKRLGSWQLSHHDRSHSVRILGH